jgi:hypothetical protein
LSAPMLSYEERDGLKRLIDDARRVQLRGPRRLPMKASDACGQAFEVAIPPGGRTRPSKLARLTRYCSALCRSNGSRANGRAGVSLKAASACGKLRRPSSEGRQPPCGSAAPVPRSSSSSPSDVFAIRRSPVRSRSRSTPTGQSATGDPLRREPSGPPTSALTCRRGRRRRLR